MKLLIINGPNLNMIGIRNKEIYGLMSYKDLCINIKRYASSFNHTVKFYQSNHEGKIIDFIQKNYNKFDGYIVNLGAYTHYSYAIRDALEIVKAPIVEIHLSDITNREDFRKISVISDIVKERFYGEGIKSYEKAIDFLGNLS